MIRSSIVVRLTAIVAFAIAGACAGMKEKAAPATAQSADGLVFDPYAPADTEFMQGMIHHHSQAIAMCDLGEKHGAAPRVLKLCQKISISQKDEIKLMQNWLRNRKLGVPDGTEHLHHMMPGMLSPEEMAALDSAQGPKFDRMFLEGMIKHHEGALKMVADLRAQGGATGSDMNAYTNDVDADQSAEIVVMREMLTSLPGSSNK